MPEAVSYYNINEYRAYPFKYSKALPLLDFFLQVPVGTGTVSIYSTGPDAISIYCNGVPYILATDIHRTYTPIKMYINNTYKGYLVLAELVSYPLVVDAELLESTWVWDKPSGVRNVYLKKNEVLTKLARNIVWEAGTNVYLDIAGDTTTVSVLSRKRLLNYLRKLRLGNGDIISGHSVSIYGTNIIKVDGDTFSTTIVDPNLKCTVVFEDGARGPQGPQGLPGLDGMDGEVIYDYYYAPYGCE